MAVRNQAGAIVGLRARDFVAETPLLAILPSVVRLPPSMPEKRSWDSPAVTSFPLHGAAPSCSAGNTTSHLRRSEVEGGGVEIAKLIYAAIASLDGYVEDESGGFDWAMPDEEVHAFVNDLERPIGIYLYGRRMYETMVFWETAGTGADQPEVFRDYAAIWRAADKIVYSRTLQTASSARTRIEPRFDRDAVRRLKHSSGSDMSIGGAELAGHAFGAQLVDELHLFLCPIVVGGGKRALPDQVHARLELLDERRFRSGIVHLHYRVGV